MKKGLNTKLIATLGIFTAISVALVLLIHFPIFPAAPYLEYDPADIPIYLITFMYGPVCGLIVTVIVSFIQGYTVSAGSGIIIIGIFMHIASTGTYVVVAGFIYKKFRTFKGALLSMGVASITLVAVMALWNIVLTPLYTGMPREAILKLIFPIIIPFNLIKVTINSVLTLILYKQTKKLVGFVWKKTERKKTAPEKSSEENKES